MKSIRSVFSGLLVISGCVGLFSLLHAQETAVPVQASALSLTATDVASFSSLSDTELETLVNALAATPTLSVDMLPLNGRAGTFYSLQNPNWPPLPCDTSSSDAWNLSGGAYLLNDVDFNYDAPQKQTLAKGVTMHAMDFSGPPSFSESSGTNTPDDTVMPPVNYGTNLWIAQTLITNSYLTGIGSNTLADVQYEIQSRTNLAQTDWQSEGFILGSETTNWTPLSVAQGSRTNQLFLRLRSWADDGSGLPIWWQLQYFGTTGVDPYGNPAGDGWSNLQKFQNGWNPNSFYTPPTPQGLNVALNSGSGGAVFSWLPSPGLVTNYLVTKLDYQTGLTTNFNVSPGNTSFREDLSGDQTLQQANWIDDYGPGILVDYSLTAQYAGGNSTAGDVLFGYQAPPTVSAMSDINGRLNLIVSGLPADVTGLKVYRTLGNSADINYYFGQLGADLLAEAYDFLLSEDYSAVYDPLTNGFFELSATGITNGIYRVPTNAMTLFGSYHFWVQGERASGTNTEWSADTAGDWSADNDPFLDARQQLKDNLRFVLRAANKTSPFQFVATDNSYIPVRISYSWPTNYAFAGLFNSGLAAASGSSYYNPNLNFAKTRPLVENYELRNFAYDANYIVPYDYNSPNDGFLATGVFFGYYYNYPANLNNLFITNTPEIFFDLSTVIGASGAVPASVLTPTQTRWIVPMNDSLAGSPTSATDRNLYGLPYVSVNAVTITNNLVYATTYSPGAAITNGFPYFETAQPGFQPAGYYFARALVDPMPEVSGFALTNTTPLLIQSVGTEQQYAGYAKLAVTNGYAGVYGYLGQYFSQAYQVATNGSVTTNTTGILSPYGDFFPTMPGPVALVTMPDLDTGARGTGMVYCASLQLDANHDGNMDLNFNGTDVTSPNSPMRFWVNNGYSGVMGNAQVIGGVLPNYSFGNITSQRDLENFARLWICGLPALPAGQGYTVTLNWQSASGNPAINLYNSVETNGGTGYLTDTNIAAQQSALTFSGGSPYSYQVTGMGAAIAQVANGTTFTFPASYFTNSANKYFLFEGAGIGSGQLTLTISKNGNYIAQTGVWLDLHDVKDFYELARATNVTSGLPPSSLVSQVQVIRPVPAAQDESKQIVVFVHGINNTDFDAQDSTETIFKRLYWSGYHGRVAEFK